MRGGERLFVSQTVHRFSAGSLDGLENESEDSYRHSHYPSQNKDNPSDICPISKILKPSVHHEPCQGPCNDIGKKNPFDEFFGQQHYHMTCRSSKNLPDADFFGP